MKITLNSHDSTNKKLDSYFPRRKTVNSAGYDLYLNKKIVLEPWEPVTISLPLTLEVPKGKSAMLFLRSSVGIKHHIRLIDQNEEYITKKTFTENVYNSINFNLLNVGHTTKEFLPGERIVQLVFVDSLMKAQKFEFEKANQTNEEVPIPIRITDNSDFTKTIINDEELVLEPYEIITFPSGIKAPIEPDTVLLIELNETGLPENLKSSLFICNGVGVIDSDYVYADNGGNIFLNLENKTSKSLVVPKNTPLFTATNVKFHKIENEIEPKEKRKGGVGSTGKAE